MRMSRLFSQTLRETPSDIESISHQLLLRAGYIRQLSTGIFSYLPLAKRSLTKIENILREGSRRRGATELRACLRQLQASLRPEAHGDALPRRLRKDQVSRFGLSCSQRTTSARRRKIGRRAEGISSGADDRPLEFHRPAGSSSHRADDQGGAAGAATTSD